MKKRIPVAILSIAVSVVWSAEPVWAQDCQPNGVPDECDVNCGPPGGVCDIPGCGLSFDCNANGIPDECEPAIACWTGQGGNDLWGNPGNWQPQVVPNDPSVQVSIVGPFFVTLDVPADIGGLVLLDGATLDVANAGDLNIGPGGLQAASPIGQSMILLGNNRTISTFGDIVLGPGAVLQSVAGIVPTDTSTVNAGNVILQEGTTPGELRIQASMRLFVQGDLVMNGNNVAPSTGPAVFGGLTEPILGIFESAGGEIEGNVQINGIAQVTVESGSPPSPPGSARPAGPGGAELRIGGNFVNTSTRPDLFHLGNGTVILDGVTAVQTFEVAGRVLSTQAEMFANNFEIGNLRIEPGASVRFVDAFDNSLASAEQESQIVGQLFLSAGASVTVDAAGLVFVTCINQGVDVNEVNFGLFASISQLLTPSARWWSVVCLGLMMLSAGTIVLGRRRRFQRTKA